MEQQSPPESIYQLMLTSSKVWMKCQKNKTKQKEIKGGAPDWLRWGSAQVFISGS